MVAAETASRDWSGEQYKDSNGAQIKTMTVSTEEFIRR
jgi:hypothetical protein